MPQIVTSAPQHRNSNTLGHIRHPIFIVLNPILKRKEAMCNAPVRSPPNGATQVQEGQRDGDSQRNYIITRLRDTTNSPATLHGGGPLQTTRRGSPNTHQIIYRASAPYKKTIPHHSHPF